MQKKKIWMSAIVLCLLFLLAGCAQREGSEALDADSFGYVAFGNSITCNEVSDFWWGTWGMAASKESKDYVHVISQWLGGQSSLPVMTKVASLKEWELASDRDALLKDYGENLNEYTDLVTIQTGENITEYRDTLTSDYAALVKMVKEKAPNAQIFMMAEILWPSEDIEAAKRAACEEYGVEFLDMKPFLDNYEERYRSELGAEVDGADGEVHTIDDEVVAAHPNDDGMACIAQEFINRIVIE